MAREDPAGMGVFSLAGRRLEVSSRATGSKTGWRIDIGPEDWESAAPIAVTAIGHAGGPCFRFELASPWAFKIGRAWWRERVCQYVLISVLVEISNKKNKK